MKEQFQEQIQDCREKETLLAFTCDLEISPEIRRRASKKDKRLLKGYRLLLDALDKYEMKGTFFTQGMMCLKYPDIVDELGLTGHEIGSHGFGHIPMTSFWPTGFFPNISTLSKRRADIKKSKQAIYSVTGKMPICFRSPYLAIDEKTLIVLESEGFLLDSSLYNSAFGKISFPYHP